MHGSSPRVPGPEEWIELGFDYVTELGGGRQSRVFEANDGDRRLAVKLTDAEFVDRHRLERRVWLTAELARIDYSVAEPVPINGRLVYPWGGWVATATPLIIGTNPDVSIVAHRELMGSTLARLHSSMARIQGIDLPRVAALRASDRETPPPTDSDQLLHGDFNSDNLLLTDHGVRVFDFDDCGYGPVEYDVANALYMVLFDSWVTDGSRDEYELFRPHFLDGYSQESKRDLDESVVDDLMDTRVDAVGFWLENPLAAPSGIRDSDDEWTEMLTRFVEYWRTGGRSSI